MTPLEPVETSCSEWGTYIEGVSREKKPTDPFEEVNSSDFLECLLGGGPGARKAFARLFRVTHERLLAFIRRYLGSAEDGQEVLQETYLAVHRGLPRFERKSRLTTWMYSMAYHKLCDRLSDKDRGHLELLEGQADLSATAGDESAVFSDISPWDAASDLVAERRNLLALMDQAIALLPPALQEVYRLRDEEGMSGEEIADLLGMPASTVRVRLHRARGQIVAWVREQLARKPAPASGKPCPEKGVKAP